LELIDDYTLKVTLKNKNVTFLTTARLRGQVLPKDYIEKVGWQEYEQNPIGSGPYKFVKHDPGQRIVLKKYNDYWGNKANVSTIEYRFYPEVTSAVMALQGGEIDFIAELPASEYARLKKNNPANLKFGSYKKFEDHRIVFNKRDDSIFSDPKLRKAVAYAIDRSELIALTRGEMAVPAVGRIPSFHPASALDAKGYQKNLEKAKNLLAEAGYPDGFKTKIFAPSGYRERVLEVQQIQQQLSKIGIEVEVVTLEWGTYLDVTGRGDAPMFRERWSSTSPSPFSFIENWHSESSWNPIFGTYNNEKVDKLIDQIKRTAEQKKRWNLYQKAQKIAMEEVPSYPLYWPINGLAYNSEINIPENLWNVFRRPIYFIDKWSFAQ
jgi:peptide/nickel transport system substrate-binding protein